MKSSRLMRHIYNLLLRWRYYSLGREDYKKSMEKEFPGNLYSLWFVSLWFAIFAFAYFMVFLFVFSSTDFIFLTLSAGALTFSAFSNAQYKKHLSGKRIPKPLIYAMITLIYTAIISTGLYISIYISDDNIALIFMVLLATAPIFVFASPIFSSMLTFAASIAFVVLNLLYTDSPIRDYNILMLSPVVPIAIFFTWFSNRYRILLSFTTLEVEKERDKYHAQSTIDELTQLGNRRDFEQRFSRYLTNYRVNEHYLCLAIMDIDYFKKYNDFYGHPKGDECLRLIGKALASIWGNSSIYAARIGGEEFALLWLEEDFSNAKNVVLQVKERIRDLGIRHEKSGVSSYVTFSIGMRIVECGAGDTMQDIYSSVDTALYEAKGRGRNNAVIFYKDKKIYVR